MSSCQDNLFDRDELDWKPQYEIKCRKCGQEYEATHKEAFKDDWCECGESFQEEDIISIAR